MTTKKENKVGTVDRVEEADDGVDAITISGTRMFLTDLARKFADRIKMGMQVEYGTEMVKSKSGAEYPRISFIRPAPIQAKVTDAPKEPPLPALPPQAKENAFQVELEYAMDQCFESACRIAKKHAASVLLSPSDIKEMAVSLFIARTRG